MAVSISPNWQPDAARWPAALVDADSCGRTSSQAPVELAFGADAREWLARDPRPAIAYWRGVLEDGSAAYAPNLQSRPGWVRCDGGGWPVTVHDGPEGNSYPASLTNQYLAYPLAELGLLPHPAARLGARLLLAGFGRLLQLAQADRVVQLDSWLASTNPHDHRLPDALLPVTRHLTRRFPDHAILVRNVHEAAGPELKRALTSAGFQLVVSRQSYFFRGQGAEFLRKSTCRRDQKELEGRTGHRFVTAADLTSADVPRITELYRLLYLDKHSRLNPQYTERFVSRALQEGWLEFHGLRHVSGRLDGVWGAFPFGDTTSVSFIGYDTTQPAETGLYRQLVLRLLREVAERQWLLNYSSGAGEFKRRRGGEAVLEDNAWYVAHLPPLRRQAFRLAGKLLNRFARPWLAASGL